MIFWLLLSSSNSERKITAKAKSGSRYSWNILEQEEQEQLPTRPLFAAYFFSQLLVLPFHLLSNLKCLRARIRSLHKYFGCLLEKCPSQILFPTPVPIPGAGGDSLAFVKEVFSSFVTESSPLLTDTDYPISTWKSMKEELFFFYIIKRILSLYSSIPTSGISPLLVSMKAGDSFLFLVKLAP